MARKKTILRLGRPCRGYGNIVRAWALLWLALGLGVAAPAARAQEGDRPAVTPAQWRELLREHADDFAQARLAQHTAREASAAGDIEAARRALESAATLDRRYEQPHFERAWLDLRSGETTVAGELWEALRDQFSGYRNQSRAVANFLIVLDLVLALTGLWILCVLAIRYLPFARHQFAAWFDPETHLRPSARVLWLPVLAPLLLAWGIVPFVAAIYPAIWIYADRRVRGLLALGLGFFVVQGVWPAPFGAALVGTDPTSVPALVERAAYEPPSGALMRDIESELAARPNDPDLLLARGLVEARRGDFRQSNESFLANLKARPHDAQSTNNLASNHFFLGDIDRAVAGFQRSAALDSTSAVPFYNLSQAYIQKLYLREGGEAMQQAMRRGFVVTQQVEQLPRGAVYYVRPGARHLWTLAWKDRDRVAPYDLLYRHQRWLGVPAGHVGSWLCVIFGVSLVLGAAFPRRKLVFECVNCGHLACRHCQGDHEGAVLCSGCAGTARRAKSEVVLQTLLRNRRRDAETTYLKRLRRLDALAFGAGRLADGMRTRGVTHALTLAGLVVGFALGRAPLGDVWEVQGTEFWTATRVVCASGLVLLLLSSMLLRASRARHLQPHPSSQVSLVGLIEGRAASRARAGGRS